MTMKELSAIKVAAAAILTAALAAGASAQVQEAAGRALPPKEQVVHLDFSLEPTRPVQLDAGTMGALCDLLRGGKSMVAQQGSRRGSINRRVGGGLSLRLDRIGDIYSDDSAGKRVTTSMIVVDSSGAGQAAMAVAKYAPSCAEVAYCAPLEHHMVPMKSGGGKSATESILRFWKLK
jgi:hypothetical protein